MNCEMHLSSNCCCLGRVRMVFHAISVSKWIVCIYIWMYSHYSPVSKYWQLIAQVLKIPISGVSCFLSSGTDTFFSMFLKPRFWCLRPVQAQTKSNFTTDTHLNRLPVSFILSLLPTAFSYLGKVLVGLKTLGWERLHGKADLQKPGSNSHILWGKKIII